MAVQCVRHFLKLIIENNKRSLNVNYLFCVLLANSRQKAKTVESVFDIKIKIGRTQHLRFGEQ